MNAPMIKLEPGRNYRVTYKIPGIHKVPRMAIMAYLEDTKDCHLFSLRPLAGTQAIERKWVIGVEPTTEQIQVPAKVTCDGWN